jgi:hypothetical protein
LKIQSYLRLIVGLISAICWLPILVQKFWHIFVNGPSPVTVSNRHKLQSPLPVATNSNKKKKIKIKLKIQQIFTLSLKGCYSILLSLRIQATIEVYCLATVEVYRLATIEVYRLTTVEDYLLLV